MRKGDILAAVDNTMLSHGVAQAGAGVEAAQSNLKNMESEYGRASRLIDQEAISRQQYDTTKTQLQNA